MQTHIGHSRPSDCNPAKVAEQDGGFDGKPKCDIACAWAAGNVWDGSSGSQVLLFAEFVIWLDMHRMSAKNKICIFNNHI